MSRPKGPSRRITGAKWPRLQLWVDSSLNAWSIPSGPVGADDAFHRQLARHCHEHDDHRLNRAIAVSLCNTLMCLTTSALIVTYRA